MTITGTKEALDSVDKFQKSLEEQKEKLEAVILQATKMNSKIGAIKADPKSLDDAELDRVKSRIKQESERIQSEETKLKQLIFEIMECENTISNAEEVRKSAFQRHEAAVNRKKKALRQIIDAKEEASDDVTKAEQEIQESAKVIDESNKQLEAETKTVKALYIRKKEAEVAMEDAENNVTAMSIKLSDHKKIQNRIDALEACPEFLDNDTLTRKK